MLLGWIIVASNVVTAIVECPEIPKTVFTLPVPTRSIKPACHPTNTQSMDLNNASVSKCKEYVRS